MNLKTNRFYSSQSRLHYETKIFLMALGAGLPGALVALILMWVLGFSLKTELTLFLVIGVGWLGFSLMVRERVVTSLRTISNLLAALREGDYSLRAQGRTGSDVLGEVNREINTLADTLQEQRRGALEATALLRKVMDEIEVAVLAFDPERKLRLINRHGEQLLGKPAEALKGRTVDELGLSDCLTGDAPRMVDYAFTGGVGRWELRRGKFRERGLSHQLVVLSDLTRALREEECQAWQRLVQVLRHEINNSLAPIHSLAETLRSLLVKEVRPADWEEDLHDGLDVIAERSKALNEFMSSYSQLTRLPKPKPRSVDVGDWIQRVVGLENRMEVEVISGPEITIQADGDQLDQLLINLVKNAVEAAQETGGEVQVSWSQVAKATTYLEVAVQDEGLGIINPSNLFVPFFTTKPHGSGLGLMLSRQIAEAHGGTLTLENRKDRQGCRAFLRLPI